eukprot:scaffold221630_cov30-Tisochrysis_lutea.AAC.9
MAGAECGKERAVLPGVCARRGALHRQIRPEQIHQVGLLGEIDAHNSVSARGTEGLHERRLAYTRAALEQDRFAELHCAKQAKCVGARSGRAQRNGCQLGRGAANWHKEGCQAESTQSNTADRILQRGYLATCEIGESVRTDIECRWIATMRWKQGDELRDALRAQSLSVRTRG